MGYIDRRRRMLLTKEAVERLGKKVEPKKENKKRIAPSATAPESAGGRRHRLPDAQIPVDLSRRRQAETRDATQIRIVRSLFLQAK